jgi:hypothetical protein
VAAWHDSNAEQYGIHVEKKADSGTSKARYS